jgi:hypothetical protein
MRKELNMSVSTLKMKRLETLMNYFIGKISFSEIENNKKLRSKIVKLRSYFEAQYNVEKLTNIMECDGYYSSNKLHERRAFNSLDILI